MRRLYLSSHQSVEGFCKSSRLFIFPFLCTWNLTHTLSRNWWSCRYIVVFDPLDGSLNIDRGVYIGTVWHSYPIYLVYALAFEVFHCLVLFEFLSRSVSKLVKGAFIWLYCFWVCRIQICGKNAIHLDHNGNCIVFGTAASAQHWKWCQWVHSWSISWGVPINSPKHKGISHSFARFWACHLLSFLPITLGLVAKQEQLSSFTGFSNENNS